MTLLATNLRDYEGELDSLLARKGDHRNAACIPARDEASTIGTIAATVEGLHTLGLVDDVVVVDEGSTDSTAARASIKGARVIPSPRGPGKGQARAAAVVGTHADILVLRPRTTLQTM